MKAKRLNSKSNIIGKNVRKQRLLFGYTQQERCDKVDVQGLN